MNPVTIESRSCEWCKFSDYTRIHCVFCRALTLEKSRRKLPNHTSLGLIGHDITPRLCRIRMETHVTSLSCQGTCNRLSNSNHRNQHRAPSQHAPPATHASTPPSICRVFDPCSIVPHPPTTGTRGLQCSTTRGTRNGRRWTRTCGLRAVLSRWWATEWMTSQRFVRGCGGRVHGHECRDLVTVYSGPLRFLFFSFFRSLAAPDAMRMGGGGAGMH